MSDIVERARSAARLQLCPFDKRAPANNLTPDDPCPVCGMLGTDDSEDKCRGADTSLFGEMADEIERLRAIVKKAGLDANALALSEMLGERARCVAIAREVAIEFNVHHPSRMDSFGARIIEKIEADDG